MALAIGIGIGTPFKRTIASGKIIVIGDFLLLETGDFLLLEDGCKLIL